MSYLKETWRGNREKQLANNEQGMCNTSALPNRICELDGIGCNVDHKFIMLYNLLQRNKAPLWSLIGGS